MRSVALANQILLGVVSWTEVEQHRRLMESKQQDAFFGSDFNLKEAVRYALDLVQDDQSYINGPPKNDLDANLASDYFFIEESERTAQADLLREVLGNPFHPVVFNPEWRTKEVEVITKNIYDSENFNLLPKLESALRQAGCEDPRILAHCKRSEGHIRGCWLIDTIMGHESLLPEPPEPLFSWDFQWGHPKIEGVAVKERLREFGVAPESSKDYSEVEILDFASWLESRGDLTWANYIRNRLALQKPVSDEDYANLIEHCHFDSLDLKFPVTAFEPFYFKGYDFSGLGRIPDDRLFMESGIPSCVSLNDEDVDPRATSRLIKNIDALIRSSPVRGIDFEWYYTNSMHDILNSPCMNKLRQIAFSNRHESGLLGPVIDALISAPLAKTLEYLTIDEGVHSDLDARALADAPFQKLRYLSLSKISCSNSALRELLGAKWLRQLYNLSPGFIDAECTESLLHIGEMPNLRNMSLSFMRESRLQYLCQSGIFPNLRSLFVDCATIKDETDQMFRNMRAPKLIDLWLHRCVVRKQDFPSLISSPIFENIQVLTLAGPRIDEWGLHCLASSPFAQKLRILRLDCSDDDLNGKMKSLSKSDLTKSSTFPKLTTLEIRYPFLKNVKKDTARFLGQLTLPAIRYLKLVGCGFDEECERIVAKCGLINRLKRLEFEDY